MNVVNGNDWKMFINFVGDKTLKNMEKVLPIKFGLEIPESTKTIIDIKEEDGETLAEIAIEPRIKMGQPS